MSFRSDARVVRNLSASPEQRVRAWGRCVRQYAPYGYQATLRHLRDRFGSLNDPAALEAALSALERSREAWLREVAAFGAYRRSLKADGRRRAAGAELARWSGQGWPGGTAAGGPPAGSPGDRPLAPEFLARYGLLEWSPAPVNHRRRARRLPTPPGLFQGWALTFGCGGSTLILAVVLVWWLADPPWPFWTTFVGTWLTVLIVVASRSMVHNNRLRRRWMAQRSHVAAAAAAAERRWVAQRRRNFDDPP